MVLLFIVSMRNRPRRNRKTPAIRQMVRETTLLPGKLIYPLFIASERTAKEEIPSMPGIFRWGIDPMLEEIAACKEVGIYAFILFPAIPEAFKDKRATYSYDSDNFYLHAIREAKAHHPDVCILTDVAMDPYSSDGHDGLVQDGHILNDETLPILADMAIAQARSGADILGPSDMMDGRIGFIRDALDKEGFTEVAIMSYCAKYASSFYGPFRDALESAPKEGDKKTYQMDPANRLEALREADLDEEEGADYLMVKPALLYLDVIAQLKAHSKLPIVAYQVSGEYAMIHAAAQKGWLELDACMHESLLSIHRAGADIVISYFAKKWAEKFSR